MNVTGSVAAQLDKFANDDMREARKRGYNIIARTKRGTLALTHEHGLYTLAMTTPGGPVIAYGKPAEVRPYLAAVYDLVSEERLG